MPPDTTVECTLPADRRDERIERLGELLSGSFDRAVERENGYTLHFAGEQVEDVARFVSRELECCSFAEYSIDVSPPYERTRLTIEGPSGTKDLVQSLIDNIQPDEAAPGSSDGHRSVVRHRYGEIASGSGESCCQRSGDTTDEYAHRLGYTDEGIEDLPTDAQLGLGCGNPIGIAGLSPGDTVVDLGSGAGFDCFLAAEQVGPSGQVIGVDMTPEMIEKARDQREQADMTHVAFRLGEIERLPVASASVDVIISNCVVNLSPNKRDVFQEAFRTLRPGGRLAIADIVVTAPLPAGVREDAAALTGCVAGSSTIDAFESILDEVGFADISITPVQESATVIREWDDDRDLSEYIVSATIEARKPPVD